MAPYFDYCLVTGKSHKITCGIKLIASRVFNIYSLGAIMTEESKIYAGGRLIAIRYVEDYNGGKRVTTQEAHINDITQTEQRGQIISDIDVYTDGSEYEHEGQRLS